MKFNFRPTTLRNKGAREITIHVDRLVLVGHKLFECQRKIVIGLSIDTSFHSRLKFFRANFSILM